MTQGSDGLFDTEGSSFGTDMTRLGGEGMVEGEGDEEGDDETADVLRRARNMTLSRSRNISSGQGSAATSDAVAAAGMSGGVSEGDAVDRDQACR